MKKHTPLKKHGGYGTTGPNKDRAVLIWQHRVVPKQHTGQVGGLDRD